MTVESGTYISDLNINYPESNVSISGGDNHIRWMKTAIKNTFPNITGAITDTHTVINTNMATVTAATNANTASTLVKRDSSGNFSAGTITATGIDVTGTATVDGKLDTVGANTDGTTLATSATNAKVRHQNHSGSTLSAFQGYTGNSWYTQISNNNGTTAYDLSLNPYGGNVGIGT